MRPRSDVPHYKVVLILYITSLNKLTKSSQLPPASLKPFLQTLLAHLPEDTTPRVISVKPEIPAPTPIRPNGQKVKPRGNSYDPSVVFVLELATHLVVRDEDTMAELGQTLAEALQGLVRDADHAHPITLSRTVYYLLSFLHASNVRLVQPLRSIHHVLIIRPQDHDFVRAPIVLHSISKLDQELIAHSANAIVKGLSLCLGGSQGLRHEIVNSPDFWSVLRALQAVPDVANDVFALVEDVVIGSASAVTTDNYEPIISMLGDYATTGSIGAQDEQRREVALRRGKGAPPKKTPLNPVVARGQRAVQLVYEATARVPHFIQQSHLEAQEGESN